MIAGFVLMLFLESLRSHSVNWRNTRSNHLVGRLQLITNEPDEPGCLGTI